MRTLMNILKNLFGNNTKISAEDIAIKDNNGEGKKLNDYLSNMKPTILYENTSGFSSGTVQLSDAFKNYELIVVVTKLGGNKSLTPKYQSIFSINTVEYYETLYFQYLVATFENNTLTVNVNGSYYLNQHHSAEHKIFKVIGYK